MAKFDLPNGDVVEILTDYIEYDEGGMRIGIPGERSCFLNGDLITEAEARALIND